MEQYQQKYYKKRADYILPITFEDREFIVSKECTTEQVDLLYVGSYLAHNYQGLVWFIKEVMPHVKARLVVVGRGMENLASKISMSQNIHIVGTVDSLEEYYLNADAVVMPIFMGGGMKVKTAEAMMYGKTIFASKEALQGYDVEGTKNIVECNSKEQFINKINNRFESSINRKFNHDVRDIFLNKYCTEKYLKGLMNIVDN